jgi:AAA15 family ATPase/GTPase
MIIQFTIGNFLSFKEQSTLSLAASALKEIQVPAEDIIFSVGTAGLLLMKSAVVYGANASGKSNFIKAFEFFKWYVINSSKDIQAGERSLMNTIFATGWCQHLQTDSRNHSNMKVVVKLLATTEISVVCNG